MTLKLFADEHVPGLVVRELRAAGHDVSWGAEHGQGAPDENRIAEAHAEGRVILTEDKDFGAWVIGRNYASHGLIRYDLFGLGRDTKPARIIEALAEIGEDVAGLAMVIEHARIRRRKL